MIVASDDSAAVLVQSYEHGLGISGLYVLNAAAITFFAVLSMNLLDRGFIAAASIEDSRRGQSLIADEDFVSQNVGMVVDPTFRMWNQSFSALLLVTHCTYAATVCSPVSWDILSTYALLLYLSLVALVQPMDNYCSEAVAERLGDERLVAAAGMMSSISSQGNMFRSVAYMLAFGYVMIHVPVDPLACKVSVSLLMIHTFSGHRLVPF